MRSKIFGMDKLAPLLIVAAGLGCSSHSTKASLGDGGKASEAGAIDGASTAGDGARRLDVRDASPLDAAIADTARDARDATIDTQRSDTKDVAGEPLTIDTNRDGARDASLDGKRDGNQDLPEQDAPVDTRPIQGTCLAPIEIPYDVFHLDLSANISGSLHLLDFPCANNGGDVVFRIQSNQPELAYADTFGSASNTALFFSDTCDSASPPEGVDMATCNDDACGTTQSQAFASLAYGYHYLIVSSADGNGGDVVVHFQRAPIGNGPLVALPKGSGTVLGTTDGMDMTRTCDTSGPKNSYWWVYCPADPGGNLHASTCKGSDWDTVLILQTPRIDNLLCNDDDMSCGMQSTIDSVISPGAGISVLTVAGTLLRSYGDYTLTYTRP